MRTRIKICGITRTEDGVAAAQLGADAIGLVFFRQSPRLVDTARAREIVDALPPFLTTVALFVDPSAGEVETVLGSVPVDLLQFHGGETPAFCASFGRPFIKAVRVRPGIDLLAYAADFGDAAGLLLDAFVSGTPGGTGETFDWDLIPRDLPRPVVLSGGLSAENVGMAVRTIRPWAVDVSSGVEAAKGIKDAAKMDAFIRGVRDADG